MKKILLSIAVLLASLIILAFTPISQKRILTRGVDSFETHQPLFGNRTAVQEITTSGPLLGVGGILVDMRRSGQPADVSVRVVDPTDNTEIVSTVITGNKLLDDQFAFVLFENPAAGRGRNLILEFSAAQATAKNPVGLRFEPSSNSSGSKRFAIQAIERVPFWQHIRTNIIQNLDQLRTVCMATIGALAIGILSLKPGWKQRPVRVRRAIELGIIISLAGLALNTRLTTLPLLHGVSGGDPYNYLFITDSLIHLENPFAGVKRLPGYPLMLVPAYVSQAVDDQAAMRTLSAVAGVGSLVLLALLTRAIDLPWGVQLTAPAILAWQKDFFWTSLRPEAYSVFTFLMLASLLLFFTIKKPWQQILFGIVLGYAAMTRQEGFVLAMLLFLASIIREIVFIKDKQFNNVTIQQLILEIKPSLVRLSLAYIPAFLIVLPFFIHNTLEYGNPLFTPYFEGERLQIVDSWEAFKDASGATWGVLGSMWKPAWESLERYAMTDAIFLFTVVTTLVWAMVPYALRMVEVKKPPKSLLSTVLAGGIIAFITVLWLDVGEKKVVLGSVPPIAAAVTVAGVIPFALATRWRGVLVLLVLGSQILIPTWFHPFPKHYQQSYPLLVLIMATGLLLPLVTLGTQGKKSAARTVASILLTAAPLTALLFIPSHLFQPEQLTTFIDQTNADTALDNVVYHAVQVARALPGPHGFDEAYLPARLYFKETAYYFPAEQNATMEQEETWLTANNIRTLVITNNQKILSEPRTEGWALVDEHVSEGKDERLYKSFVYTHP